MSKITDTIDDVNRIDEIESNVALAAVDWNHSTKTAAYTMIAKDFVYADTLTAGAFTLSLPLTPSANEAITVFNTDTTNTLTVDGNGKNIILRDITDTSIEVNTVIKLEFIYDGTQWRIS